MDDMSAQFGPEPTEDSVEHRYESIQRKLQNLNHKWKRILLQARQAASEEEYSSVIRHLSVMRIFLEGSQATTYSCDPMECERRDMLHLVTLQKLGHMPVC